MAGRKEMAVAVMLGFGMKYHTAPPPMAKGPRSGWLASSLGAAMPVGGKARPKCGVIRINGK